MLLDIEHRLSFAYDAWIRESFLELRMQPKSGPNQTLHSYVLAVGPPSKISRYRDWNENVVHHFTIANFHERIAVIARSQVNTHPSAPPLEAVVDPMPLGLVPWTVLDFLQTGGPVLASEALDAFNHTIEVSSTMPLGEQVRAAGRAIRHGFTYRKEVTRYDSSTDEFLRLRAGVCQDFTHLMLGVLRLRGIPCRYVSGYLHVERESTEASQSHAWIEFFSPSAGWIPFDPTHYRAVDERYVVVGHGRHYDDVPPNRGIFRGNARESLRAEVLTHPSAPKAVAALHEEVEHIDLPVFQEIPARTHDWTSAVAEDAVAQQQQQQQQSQAG
jgi:transglutaminase-like putative cysteine protease